MRKIKLVFCCLLIAANVFSQKEKIINYTVKQSEGLYRIAKNNSLTIDVIKKYNPGLDESNLKVGQVIKLPVFMQNKQNSTTVVKPIETKAPSTKSATQSTKNHSVEKGETLFAIARKYNVSVAEIESLNAIKREDGLKLGQVLKIPSAKAVSAPQKVSTATVVETTEEPSAAFLDYKKSDAQLVHTVMSGETAPQIAEKYNLNVRELYLLNNLPNGTKLSSGMQLTVGSFKTNAETKLPLNTEKKVIKTEIVEEPEIQTPIAVKETVVEKKETVQERITPSASVETKAEKAAATVVEKNTPAVSSVAESVPDEYAHVIKHYESEGFSKKTIRGIATFIPAGTMANTNSAYYNYAETGSVIKVTNLMSKKTVYVKVIGKLPKEESHTEVILKLTQEMADELKVNEDKYLVEVTSYAK